MSQLDPDHSPKYEAPVIPAWETAFRALPEDVQSEIMVNAVVLRRAIKDRRVPIGERAALELVARLYVGLMTKRKAVT